MISLVLTYFKLVVRAAAAKPPFLADEVAFRLLRGAISIVYYFLFDYK